MALNMNTVPFIPEHRISNEALRLLAEWSAETGTAITPPIPIDEIIECHLGLSLVVEDLQSLFDDEDVLGATWIDDKKVGIDVSLQDKEGRFSFTGAHEAGHWRLHRPLYEAEKRQPSLFGPKSKEPSIVCRTSKRKPKGEWQADYFAACLLMPENLVRDAFHKCHGRDPVVIDADFLKKHWIADIAEKEEMLRFYAEQVRDAGNFSNVSIEAMRIRLNKLRLVFEPKENGQMQMV